MLETPSQRAALPPPITRLRIATPARSGAAIIARTPNIAAAALAERNCGTCIAPRLQDGLGLWIEFTSAETLEKALRYLGARDEQIAEHQNQSMRAGNQSHSVYAEQNRCLPNSHPARNIARCPTERLWRPPLTSILHITCPPHVEEK
jgi:hypothetical protein